MNSSQAGSPQRFVDTHGQLPPMWPRRTIFFANLLSLFFGNADQTRVLADEIGELDSYSNRLIPILNLLFAGPGNLLVVEREPDPDLCRYLREDLGLALPEICVLAHQDYLQLGRQLEQNPEASLQELLPGGHALAAAADRDDPGWLDGYVTDDILPRIAERMECPTISSMQASQAGNNKLQLHQFLTEQGLPTVATELAEGPDDLARCAARLQQQGYLAAVVRSQVGASGVGMLKLHDLSQPDQFPAVPEYFFHEGPCLVQGWLSPEVLGISQIRSPSTQLFLDEDQVHAFDTTEQILSGHHVHEGNESPPPYLKEQPELRAETMRQAALVGGWLHETGYRGTASIDWLVVQRESHAESDVYVCEINARVTGATYPSLLAKHFHPSGAWLLRNLRLSRPVTAKTLLNIFASRNHLFQQGRRAGVLPLNFNFGKDGLVHKGQFICVGEDTAQCHHFLTLAEQDLPGGWKADRD
ncbi:hypothetical protein [Allorhodopirellula solitaria]|uniref:[Butirosin acyl-carrier protein]--L-glutamate ligase n=1 Tax=Allorhodopirellula solitaria TaxID=2527987 RepID=A0A5C5X8D9_9BACT|nr:hypothetical protein [Allorhodopirellula solitaria]TWT59190.1 [Butirosin acyl-carrier protein]--L-glutamate ligase [Allorhodopirellula solitaria]